MDVDKTYAGYEEDLIDRCFSRPLARPLVRLGIALRVHPNLVSLLGAALGVYAGTFFRFSEAPVVAVGVGLMIVSILLDNADGDLARATGKSSELGYVIDGVCDNLVFGSAYISGVIGLWPTLAWWTLPLASLAALSNSYQSAMLDFYKMQWRYLAMAHDGYRFKDASEVRGEKEGASPLMRLFLTLRTNYARQQARLSRQRLRLLPTMEAQRAGASFRDRYFRLNRGPMRGWFVMGPNWHFLWLFACGLLGRMDLFFLGILLPFNLLLIFLIHWQARRDRALVSGGAGHLQTRKRPARA